jgi:mannose-1-phosphate guanylyltransferase
MARKKPALVTLGIRPTAPETGYGYIEAGEHVATVQNHAFHQVSSFHEKPDLQRAEQYLATGNFYWNSGMFVWQAKVVLEAIQQYLPGLHADLEKLNSFLGTDELEAGIARVYPDLESISIDYGVMEKAADVLVVPADFGWNDLGSWASMAEIWPKDDQQNAYQGEYMALESHRNVVYSRQRLCVLLGIEDLIVVDTEDVLLVCPVNKAQHLGQILDLMKQRGMEQYL